MEYTLFRHSSLWGLEDEDPPKFLSLFYCYDVPSSLFSHGLCNGCMFLIQDDPHTSCSFSQSLWRDFWFPNRDQWCMCSLTSFNHVHVPAHARCENEFIWAGGNGFFEVQLPVAVPGTWFDCLNSMSNGTFHGFKTWMHSEFMYS